MFPSLSIKSFPRLPLQIYPAVAAATWLILGILLVLCPAFWGISWALTAVTVTVAAVALALCSPSPTRPLSGFFPLGVLLALLHLWAPWQTYARFLPRHHCGAEIRGVVVKTSTLNETLAWLKPVSKATVRLKALRLNPQAEWNECSGKVLLRVPPTTSLAYGAEIRATGAFQTPDLPTIPGGFNYRNYLRSFGIRHVFSADDVQILAQASGWRVLLKALYTFKDQSAERLQRHVPNEANKRILLAMTLGCREGLDPATRMQFLRSGTIHIFAISGLHVGIVASILLLVLCLLRVPLRIRWLTLPLLLGLYVLSTGAAPSALRAWLMLSIWALAKSRFRATVALNTVAFAALVLLIGNPLSLAQTGFQFSFLIVSVLVGGWPLVSQLIAAVEEKGHWIPLRLRRFRRLGRIRHKCLQTLGGAGLAWFGSAGLIIWTNYLLIPSALLVNIGISLLAWLTLFLAGPKIIVASLPFAWPDTLLAGILNLLLDGIRLLVDLGGRSPGSVAIARSHSGMILAYYALLLVAVLPRVPGKWRTVAGSGVVLILACILLRPTPITPRTTIFTGGASNVPALVLCSGTRLAPIVVNTGGSENAGIVATWLRTHGYDAIDALILPGAKWGIAAGTQKLFNVVTVRSLVLPPRIRKNGAIANAYNSQSAKGRRVRFFENNRIAGGRELRYETAEITCYAHSEKGNSRYDISRRLPEGTYSVSMVISNTGQVEISHAWNGCKSAPLQLTASLKNRIIDLPSP